MRRLLARSSIVVAAALVTSPAAFAGTTDPCALITVSDASTALGSTPPKGKPSSTGAYRVCTYTVRKKTLTVRTRKVARKSDFVKGANAAPGGPAFPIHGVGADAFSAADGTILLVWKDGIEVSLVFGGVQPFVATQQSLAKAALGRL